MGGFYKYILVLVGFLAMAFLGGCSGKSEQAKQAEKSYAEFVRKRQKKRYGVDIETINRAMKYYPRFRQSLFSGDVVGFRRSVRADSLDFTEFMPALMMILEIDDSSKTPTGIKYLNRKYNPQIVAYVQAELARTRGGK